jgi:hypothetical protein
MHNKIYYVYFNWVNLKHAQIIFTQTFNKYFILLFHPKFIMFISIIQTYDKQKSSTCIGRKKKMSLKQ